MADTTITDMLLAKSLKEKRKFSFQDLLDMYQILFNKYASIEYGHHLLLQNIKNSFDPYPVDIEEMFEKLGLSIQKNTRPMILSLLKKHKFLRYKDGKVETNLQYCRAVYKKIGCNRVSFIITYGAFKQLLKGYRKGQRFATYFDIIDRMQFAYNLYVKRYSEISDVAHALLSMKHM